MDYTEVPRSLIYKDRTDLKDFGVQIHGTLNNYLFTQMRKLTLLHCGTAKEIALQCLNNAYYICTLIQLDDFPDLSMDKYERKLLEVKIPFIGDVYQASMALVCLLLAAYDEKYKQKDDLLIESIHHWTSSNKWTGSNNCKSFDDIIKTCNTDSFTLPKSEFAPRDIIEVIETFSVRNLQVYSDYICERLALIEDSRKRTYGADLAIAHLRDDQRELCENTGYNPKKDYFKYADNDPSLRDFTWEDKIRDHYQQSKKAIEYYQEHYPKMENGHHDQQTVSDLSSSDNAALVAENEQLRQQLAQHIIEIQELGKENAKLEKENIELREQPEKSIPITSDSFEELKSRAETLQSLYDAADNRLKRYETILGTEEELSKEKKFSIAERIIFCSALLGCSLSEDDIIQQQMAKMIMRFSGDKWRSIRTTISEMNGKRTALVEVANKAMQEKDAGARMVVWRKEEEKFQGLTNAALNVYYYLHSAVKGGTVGAKAHQCKQAMENIDLAYYLTERKLITPTYRQPQGDEFVLPPDVI